MKIKIGNYREWIGPYQIAEKVLWFIPDQKDEYGFKKKPDIVHNFGKWLSEDKDGNDSLLTKTCNLFHSKKKRLVKIKIDDYDVWNAHNTASLILLPLFQKLKENKHSFALVSDEDVPDFLKSTEESAKLTQEEIDCGATDKNAESRYEWVLNEILFALKADNEDWEEQFRIVASELDLKEYPEDIGNKFIPIRWKKEGKTDYDGMKKYQERIDNGFRLMGKYWQTLWD